MSKELIEHLRELSASRKPHATGAHGQIIGMESYRIVANGFALECIDEAADRIEELELLIAADTGTEGAVANLQGRVEELERVVKFQRKAWTADLAENNALQADIERLREALEARRDWFAMQLKDTGNGNLSEWDRHTLQIELDATNAALTTTKGS